MMKQFRTRLRPEQGITGFQTLLVLIVIAVSIYSTRQIFMVYSAHWTLEKNVKTVVRFAFVNLSGERQPQIRTQVLAMLDGMGAQYDKKKITVTVDDMEKKILIDAWYAQTVTLPFFPNPKQFHLYVQNTGTLE